MAKWLDQVLGFVNKFIYEPLAYQANEIFEAQELMQEFGMFPPAVPNRMDCAPSIEGILESSVDSFRKGTRAIKSVERANIGQAFKRGAKAGAFSATVILGVGKKLLDDTAKAQACMNAQDEQHAKDNAEYEQQVLDLVGELRSNRLTPAQELQQRKDDYIRVTNERGARGQVGITWWEYNAIIDKGLDPMSPFALDSIPRSELCPHGRYNPSASIGRAENDNAYRDVEKDSNEDWRVSNNSDRYTATYCNDTHCGTGEWDKDTGEVDSWGCSRDEADNNGGHCAKP